MAHRISVTVSPGTPGRGQRVTQVPGHQIEVVHGDAAALMHLLHRRTGVGLGPAERGRKEFACLPLRRFIFVPAKKPAS